MISSSNITSGMITQLISNSSNLSNDFQNTFNYSVAHKILDFNPDNSLILSRDYDSYVPQYIAIHLYPGQNLHLTAANRIATVCRFFNKIRVVMQISEQTVLQLPLSLLHALSPAFIHDDKLCIKIPFAAIFNQINVIGLYHSSVTFAIKDFIEIANYANSFSLVTKVYMYNVEERNNMISVNSRNFIQQIGTMHVTNSNPNNGRTFQIRTNILNGPTKGFLIQCSILDLTSIKFYVNNLLRIDYEPLLIQTACVKLSDNLLYLPFNECTDFTDRGTNTFSGAINLSRLENSTLCLQFALHQSKVVIHNVYYNYLRQSSGLGGLHIDYRPAFIETTTSDHPILPIIGTPPNTSLIDMSGNYIQPTFSNNPSIRGRITGVIHNTLGLTGPPPPNTSLIDMSGNYIQPTFSNDPSIRGQITGVMHNTPGLTGPPITDTGYFIPTGITHYRVINPERTMCYITHEDIMEGQRYMSCSSCANNFVKSAIKHWLSLSSGNLRRCPTCRQVWTNFDIYINQNLPEEHIYSMP